VLPGRWLNATALLRGDLATVARVAQEGIAGEEHKEFVSQLQKGLVVQLTDASA
jgi:hypothetical protein